MERSSAPAELRTPRVLLREWRDSDREPFAALNADSKVMHHFPGVMSRADSDAFADRIVTGMAERGWGL
jgi:RimJ/RimL family protein N-acetyltransferase